ncbi:MAG: LLM class flavin-dependent oxidoreductase [Pseudoxanthomonas sp.]
MTCPEPREPGIHWFLPTNGDGHRLTSSGLPRPDAAGPGERSPSLDYLRLVVRATEQAGFDAIMLPVASGLEDPWLVAAALATEVPRLRFLLTHRPGIELPDRIVRKCATLQSLAPGRLLLHIVSGSSPFEQRSLGDHLDHDARYARTAEFVQLLGERWHGRGQDHCGRYYRDVGPNLPAQALPMPPLWFGGASPMAERIAAAQVQVHVMWGEPPELIRQRVARMQRLADGFGRMLRFGLRLHVFAAPTAEQAWAHVQRLVADIPASVIDRAQSQIEAYDSVGQRRQHRLLQGRGDGVRDLEVSPNLWAGVGLVRGGAGTALVGSYDQVAQRIGEYREMGVDHFVLSGYPHLEQAIHLGEHLLPRLRQSGLQGRHDAAIPDSGSTVPREWPLL